MVLTITLWFLNDEIQLEKYGTEAIAEVYQINATFYSSHALLEYKVNEKRYTTAIKIQQGNNFSDRVYYGRERIKARVGHKFKILYSRRNPRVSRIISEYPIE
ncbi:MAG: hypothetical protein EAS48_09445 [Chryseobacterium sp.]|nr:MAG: hypothetical protein EAS48_09445 [Chryseobacterium sp.]